MADEHRLRPRRPACAGAPAAQPHPQPAQELGQHGDDRPASTASRTRGRPARPPDARTRATASPARRASPSSDSAMFENGSGEVLTAARVVALATWLVAASVPPSSAATVAQVAWSAPNTAAGERGAGRDADRRVCTMSQTRVDAGDLVGEELEEQHQPARAEHPRLLQQRAARPAGRPSRVSRPGR